MLDLRVRAGVRRLVNERLVSPQHSFFFKEAVAESGEVEHLHVRVTLTNLAASSSPRIYGITISMMQVERRLRFDNLQGAIGIEFPILPDPRPARLFGVSPDGANWQNNDIVPNLGRSPVLTAFGSSAYVVGADAQDNGQQKIFELDATSGQILRRISTEDLCTSCGVAIAPTGSLYINDLSSTKIYKVQ